MNDAVSISTFHADDIETHLSELGELLSACVHDGASISFILPFTRGESELFWSAKVLPVVRAGKLTLLV
ncbi:GNAT family N-acetyltransferase, partial [Rhizobiaceae sp. 2RAB30]